MATKAMMKPITEITSVTMASVSEVLATALLLIQAVCHAGRRKNSPYAAKQIKITTAVTGTHSPHL
ncbi:hypothetical protein MBOU_33820 [Mycobacterium bourgelatii]|uniref:Uncharacterized protein n=1 Tax=Mycobacterium bourgelatii TaxID=1273442 RepID=A0A7I9YRN0_MYCBU|nr:hypothetical protein MBOU_33820 [Mycobacterium bourgelatii]